MPALLLREEDIRQLIRMPEAIAVMQTAFQALADGEADNVPRVRAQGPGITLHSMSAAAAYLGLVGWKQYTTTRQGARFRVGLHDASGQLVAWIEADRLGQIRTGAVTGLAARYLAPDHAEVLGLLGSGWQAESQLAAVAAACPLRRVHVYSRDATRRREFAERMARQLDLEVVPVDEARQAVEQLPIVVTATSSRQPVLDGDWLADDALVAAIGSNWLNKAELDVQTFRRAKQVVCDSTAACRAEAGDLVPALAAGAFHWEAAVELAAIVGQRSARPAGPAIVVFKSVGLAIEDVALAAHAVELARQQGLGEELPL